jgi:hypothetical protein
MKFYINECQVEVAIRQVSYDGVSSRWVWGYQVAGKKWGRDVLCPKRNHMWSGNEYVSAEVSMMRALMAIDILSSRDDLNSKTRYLPDFLLASSIDPLRTS